MVAGMLLGAGPQVRALHHPASGPAWMRSSLPCSSICALGSSRHGRTQPKHRPLVVVQAAPQPGAAPDPHGSSSSSNSKPHGSGSSQDAGQPLTFSFGPRPSLASQEALQESLNTLDALPPMQQSSSHPQGQGEHHHEHHHHHHHGEHGEHGDHEHHNKTHMPLAKLQKIQPPKLPSNLHQLPGMAKEHLSGMAASAKEHLPQLKELGPEDQRHSPREIFNASYRSVLLFVGVGTAVVAGLNLWAMGSSMRRSSPYTFNVIFSEAEGIEAGTALRLKGVRVGEVASVSVDLEKVTATLEVYLGDTYIPRGPGTSFEYNRMGLLNPEPFIDISTPPLGDLPPVPSKDGNGNGKASTTGTASTPGATTAAAAAATPATPPNTPTASRASSFQGADVATTASLDPTASSTATAASGTTEETYEQRKARKAEEQRRVRKREERELALLAAALATCARPADVDACREQGVLVCAGDTVEGSLGGSSDELTRRMVMANRGPGRIQDGPWYNKRWNE